MLIKSPAGSTTARDTQGMLVFLCRAGKENEYYFSNTSNLSFIFLVLFELMAHPAKELITISKNNSKLADTIFVAEK